MNTYLNATVRSFAAFACLFAASAQGLDISALAPTQVVEGETFGIQITGDFTGSPPVMGGFQLNWNPALLSLTNWNVVLPNEDSRGDGSGGSIELGFYSPSPANFSGTIATLTFTAATAGTVAIDVGPSMVLVPLPPAVNYAGTIVNVLAANPCVNIECDDRLRRQDAEIGWRYIGIVPQVAGEFADCPTAEPWAVSDLFAFEGHPIPRALQQYCLYTFTNGVPDPTVLLALRDNNALLQVDPDIMAASFTDGPMGEYTAQPFSQTIARGGTPMPLKDIVAVPLQTFFREQAGATATEPPGTGQIRLGILDSYPGSGNPVASPERGTSPHGHALIHLADDLVCGEYPHPTCPVQVTSNLALPWTDAADPTSADLVEGGVMGSPVDVAQAIRRELVRLTQSNQTKMVINLSLGWNTRLNKNAEGDLNAAVKAVRTAFEIASCRGVVVIAAAGNPDGGFDPASGPLSPALFEDTAAPNKTTCDDDLLPPLPPSIAADFPPGGGSKPLVYAAGGVRSNGRPVHRRANSEPLRVAFADHAIATDAGGAPTGTITGTSAGALVISAATAMAWTHAPAMPGWELMQHIDASRVNVVPERTATFCPSGLCNAVGRIDLCNAAAAVCAASGTCTTTFTCPASVPYRNPLLDENAVIADFGTTMTTTVDVSDAMVFTNSVIGECSVSGGTYTLHYPGSVPNDPCPHRQYATSQATPWTDPQPGNNNCEDCPANYASPGTLYIEIGALLDSNPALADATSATLYCNDSPTSQIAYALTDLDPASDTDRLIVTGISINCMEKGLFLAMRLAEDKCDSPISPAEPNCASLVTPLLVLTDPDLDGIPASIDNCSVEKNTDQRDTNGDGYGNICDPDLDNNGVVNFGDVALWVPFFNTACGFVDEDFNGDGVCNFGDFSLFPEFFQNPPGPSGIAP